MPPILTKEQIEEVVVELPIQNRVMLRLLLLQYLDVTDEDIGYMAADQPDPRLAQGERRIHKFLSREAINCVADRAEEYRAQVRQKRERTSLQIECLRKQIALSEGLSRVAAELLSSRFGYESTEMEALKKGARSAIPKPAIRSLNKKWDGDEINEDEYLKARLPIEYQTEVRKQARFRARLDTTQRELGNQGRLPLQDHEIAHIWGIPLGSLSARKVKTLHQYLQNLQAKAQVPGETDSGHQVDLWRETFTTLSSTPVQRSVAVYDGMEESEAALMDKLTAFASGLLGEEIESRFWQVISRNYSPNAVEGQGKRQSLFSLQRLNAILTEMETDPVVLEQELLAKIAPKPKVAAGAPQEPAPETVPQLGEMAEHVLRSFRGEDRS